MNRVVVVGAGVAGLATALEIVRRGARDAGIEVMVLERAPRAGGNLRSERTGGFLVEWGPNGFLDSAPDTLALVRHLDLASRVQVSDDRARTRFVYRGGRLHALPGGPGAFLRSGLLSWPAKLRVAAEPFARKRPDGDETIHAFAARRIGREAADVLIDAMVSGVFGGDARRLSLRACFPKMWEMESQYGGLFRAMWGKHREGRRRRNGEAMGSPLGRLTSFEGGIEELIHGLTRALGQMVRTGAQATAVTEGPDGFQVHVGGADPIDADAVVLAGPASQSAWLTGGLDADLARVLREIPSAPMAVVALGFETSRLRRPLDGFGFLVPRGEGPRILGALWDSSVYPGRAPEGHALIRVMAGGAHDPAAVSLDDEALVDLVRRDLRVTMGLDTPPSFVRIIRHEAGIPQYVEGHLDRLARIDERLARHPGLFVAGNSYRGVAINACIAEAGPLADRVLRSTAAKTRTPNSQSPTPNLQLPTPNSQLRELSTPN